MSESAPASPATPEQDHSAEIHQPAAERHSTKVERSEKARRKHEVDPSLQAAIAREEIARTKTDNPLERLATADKASQPAQPLNINRELKAITLNRELQNIRRKESLPQRSLSRLIHQPAVRFLSEIADKTVSRPSGLLGGGLVAFIGTSGYLYLAKSLGFRYNYLVFLLLFAGGFAIGLGLELVVHMATSARRHSND